MIQLSLFENSTEEKFQKAIIEDLKRGNGVMNGKERIREIYKKDISKNERIKLLKNEYGIGGYSLKASGRISQQHNSKGIEIELYTGEAKHYSWSKICGLLQMLINTEQYN